MRPFLFVVLLALPLVAACGKVAPKAYSSSDVTAAWQAHGLHASLESVAVSGNLPPAAPKATGAWYVFPKLTVVPFFGLTIFTDDADALAYVGTPPHPTMLTTRYAQRNIVFSYLPADAAVAAPYVSALADLR